jgi:hypothetical protein
MAYKRISPQPVIEGGTGAQTLAAHAVLVGEGTSAIVAVGPGTSGQILQSAGASADPAYTTATYPGTTTASQLLYSSSNNVVTGLTVGDYGVLISNSTGVPSWLANGTTGQVLTATTSGNPSWASPSSGGFTWIAIAGGTTNLVAGNGYRTSGVILSNFVLPTNSNLGDTIKIIDGQGAGGWEITYGTGQSIRYGLSISTTTTGNLFSSGTGDTVELVCTTASATAPLFTVFSSIGNLSIT